MKIGIFDSGLGGLSVLHSAEKMIPDADFIYYADECHVPYGEKKPEEIHEFVDEIFDFLLAKKVDGIIIACNTATTIVDKEYRKQFPVPIVGMEPAVKMAVDLYGEENKRILVAATPVTINGNKLKRLVTSVDKEKEADLIALPGLVRYAESLDFYSEEVKAYLNEQLDTYDLQEYGTIVLGCTHFNYFKRCFQEVFGDAVHFVDGNEGTVHQLMRLLSIEKADRTKETKGKVEYYFSGRLINSKEQKTVESCMDQLDRVFDIN